MPPVRHWKIRHIVAAWLAAPAVFLVLRWLVHAAVYEAHIEGQRVVVTSGAWTASFASTLTVVAGVVCGLVLLAVTLVWMSGRKDRRRMAASTENPERRPLM